MVNKLQELKGKPKLKIYKNISKYYDEMNIRMQSGSFQFQEDCSSKNVQNIDKIYHEVMLLMIFLQTGPQVKNMSITYFDLYYTVIKNRDDDIEMKL